VEQVTRLKNALARRVVRVCGSGAQFEGLGYVFGNWVLQGDPPRATVDGVEPYVAHYLARAERVGQRWGRAAGLVVGIVLAPALVALAWLVRVIV
jgi:hypothetical protein